MQQTIELAEIADSPSSASERAQGMLERLRHLVPFDAAWLALADPMSSTFTSLASTDLNEGTLQYLNGRTMAHDIEVTHADRDLPPLSPSDLPYPAEELRTWAECFIPAGFHEALGVALFDRRQRHVGHLALLSCSKEPPSPVMRRRLHQLTPVVARGIDPLRSLAVAARVVKGATAGAVLCRDTATRPLPGLHDDPLLASGSALVALACSCLDDGQPYTSFLWPLGGPHAQDGHVRVTVLASGEDPSTGLLGTVVLSPAMDLRGLTPRELEVLGLLIDGCSNQQIAAALIVAPRTVAAHIEHILAKLDAPSRTLAAVRAERDGLYVPAAAGRRPCVPERHSDDGR
jgi:DNA-binding CsgD family transcriptional regulator